LGIKPSSHKKTNQIVLSLILSHVEKGAKILDLGAGTGYFSSLLYNTLKSKSLNPEEIIQASDYYPENFKFDKLSCQFGDFNTGLPYEDNTFDVVCSIEVIEHIEDQFQLMREIFRIIKPGGILVLTTPNIMNINSRLAFLGHGLYLQFDVLPVTGRKAFNGHIHPVSYNFLSSMVKKCGFKKVQFYPDRVKSSSLFWLIFTYPFIFLSKTLYYLKIRRKKPDLFQVNKYDLQVMNSFKMLTSRTAILKATK
jgi:ubiquinone/menaquinone biosynthesis C-methylase UbiE